jgi:hypothetical protein
VFIGLRRRAADLLGVSGCLMSGGTQLIPGGSDSKRTLKTRLVGCNMNNEIKSTQLQMYWNS